MDDLDFEVSYWGDCTNTFDEDQKHYVYARYMGLSRDGYSFDLNHKTVVDIGGGPTSMLLKCLRLGEGCTVVDPISYPAWTQLRYEAKGVKVIQSRGEDFTPDQVYDEAWIYNCLQHTEDPARILKNALSCSRLVRLFEWIDIPPHAGHPVELTEPFLNETLGTIGQTVQLAHTGCFGKAYYAIVKGVV